jgi:hypothetical protein
MRRLDLEQLRPEPLASGIGVRLRPRQIGSRSQDVGKSLLGSLA